MKRTALAVTAALALLLTACGGAGGDDPTVATTSTAASASAAPSAGAPSAGAPSAGAPSAGAPSAAPTACPITATAAEPPAGVGTDLAVKPVVTKGAPPRPTTLTYADVVTGDGAEVVVGSAAKLKYVGALYDNGTEFDSSWSRGPDETFDIKACFEGAIAGFSVGPIGMKVGGRRLITIPAAFGYGAQGSPPAIGPDKDLIFVVDLVAVDAAPAPAAPAG